jgi:hypothetical protein
MAAARGTRSLLLLLHHIGFSPVLLIPLDPLTKMRTPIALLALLGLGGQGLLQLHLEPAQRDGGGGLRAGLR